MAGKRKNWTVGESLTRTELQRGADLAAQREDRALDALYTLQSGNSAPPGSGGTTKMVIPLMSEILQDTANEDGITLSAAGSISHRQLAAPAPRAGIGVAGGVALRACRLISGSSRVINFSVTAHKFAEMAAGSSLGSPVVASNISGLLRNDLVYLTASVLATNASANRKFKDPSTGAITTQSLVVEQAPLLTLNILQGTPGAGLPTIPADSVDGLTVNWSIANVAVANGYAAGAPLTASQITQIWVGGGIDQNHVLGRIGGSAKIVAAAPGIGTPALSERIGAVRSLITMLRIPTGGAQTLFLDGANAALGGFPAIDWRRRFVRVSACRPLESGGVTAHPAVAVAHGLTQAGGAANDTFRVDTKWFFTGAGNVGTSAAVGINLAPNNADLVSGAGAGSLAAVQLSCLNADGSLLLFVNSYVQVTVGGDYWIFFIEYTDQINAQVV